MSTKVFLFFRYFFKDLGLDSQFKISTSDIYFSGPLNRPNNYQKNKLKSGIKYERWKKTILNKLQSCFLSNEKWR